MTTLAEWETEYDAAVQKEQDDAATVTKLQAELKQAQTDCYAHPTFACAGELIRLESELYDAQRTLREDQATVANLLASKPTAGTAPAPTPTPTPTPTPGVPPPVDLGGYTPSGLALAWRELIGVFKDEVPAAGEYVRSTGQDLWTRLR